jgi:hypothetical protein
MNFIETMALYRALSALTLKCPEKPPKISIVDNQNEGYALKIARGLSQQRCNCWCIRNFSEHYNFHVTEDDKYLDVRIPKMPTFEEIRSENRLSSIFFIDI